MNVLLIVHCYQPTTIGRDSQVFDSELLRPCEKFLARSAPCGESMSLIKAAQDEGIATRSPDTTAHGFYKPLRTLNHGPGLYKLSVPALGG